MGDLNLPIDIQIGKLVEWLLSRRHVKRDWNDSVKLIRQKINNAIQDMPEHPQIVELLSGAYINYFHCLKIIEILKETEKESKNIFGWYTSQRMKDWQEIVNFYERDNVHLGESGHFLVRNANYEIPSLKKQIAKNQLLQQEYSKRILECEKLASSSQEQYEAECKRIGIGCENLKEQIFGLLKSLPDNLQQIGESIKNLSEARQFYQDYVKFIFNSDKTLLPLLKFVIERGDVSLYEWKHGETPLQILSPNFDCKVPEEITTVDQLSDNEIDFGDDLLTSETQNETNLDNESQNKTNLDSESNEIDWGLGDDNEKQIICDISLLEEYDTSGIVVESSGTEGGIAKGEEAHTLLFNETTRNQIINECHELEGFLSQRLCELSMEESVLAMNLFSNAPKSIQYQDKDFISNYVNDIKRMVDELTCDTMQHLFMISSSPRYVDRLIHNLQQHLRESDRFLKSAQTFEQKRTAALNEERILTKQLGPLITSTKILQKQIQEEISKKYGNRPVFLIGVI